MAGFPSIEVENHLFVSKAVWVLKNGQGIMDLSYPLIHQTSLSFSKLRSTRDPSAEAVHSSSWQRHWNPGPIQHYWKASHPVSHPVTPSPQATHLGPSCTYLLQQIPDLYSWGLCLAGSLFWWHTCIPLLLVPSPALFLLFILTATQASLQEVLLDFPDTLFCSDSVLHIFIMASSKDCLALD